MINHNFVSTLTKDPLNMSHYEVYLIMYRMTSYFSFTFNNEIFPPYFRTGSSVKKVVIITHFVRTT